MSEDQKTLGLQFLVHRETLKLSQTAAGCRAVPPVRQKTVSNIETGAGDPTLASLLAYAEALGCELSLTPRQRRR
jgi:transcriptional regulator with XRE-family HTH domain